MDKLITEFTSPIAKSTSPGLSDTASLHTERPPLYSASGSITIKVAVRRQIVI